jgi:hypothetical protein
MSSAFFKEKNYGELGLWPINFSNNEKNRQPLLVPHRFLGLPYIIFFQKYTLLIN